MTWTWICKVLCDPFQPWRFERETVLGMSWGYIHDVLFCERDAKRNPVLPAHLIKRKTYAEQIREVWETRGYPPHLVEEKVREAVAGSEQRILAARLRAGGK